MHEQINYWAFFKPFVYKLVFMTGLIKCYQKYAYNENVKKNVSV